MGYRKRENRKERTQEKKGRYGSNAKRVHSINELRRYKPRISLIVLQSFLIKEGLTLTQLKRLRKKAVFKEDAEKYLDKLIEERSGKTRFADGGKKEIRIGLRQTKTEKLHSLLTQVIPPEARKSIKRELERRYEERLVEKTKKYNEKKGEKRYMHSRVRRRLKRKNEWDSLVEMTALKGMGKGKAEYEGVVSMTKARDIAEDELTKKIIDKTKLGYTIDNIVEELELKLVKEKKKYTTSNLRMTLIEEQINKILREFGKK